MAIGKEFFELEDAIGYSFSDISYLENALTHSSFANEKRLRGSSINSNERLEFLGDAVLELVVSEFLYDRYKGYGEGALTRMRQYLVCEKTLARIARTLRLGDYLNIGKGEEMTECRARPKVLADALEAVIAAIYVDGGKDGAQKAREVVLRLIEPELASAVGMQSTDYKTMLQQLVEKDGAATLEYCVTDECGPEHDKLFTVVAKVNNNIVGRGASRTKKDAEMRAAREALILFGVSV